MKQKEQTLLNFKNLQTVNLQNFKTNGPLSISWKKSTLSNQDLSINYRNVKPNQNTAKLTSFSSK